MTAPIKRRRRSNSQTISGLTGEELRAFQNGDLELAPPTRNGRPIDSMRVYTRHLGGAGVDEVEVKAPMGVVFKTDDADFEVVAGTDGGIEVRLTSMRGGATALVIEPRAANTITVRARK